MDKPCTSISLFVNKGGLHSLIHLLNALLLALIIYKYNSINLEMYYTWLLLLLPLALYISLGILDKTLERLEGISANVSFHMELSLLYLLVLVLIGLSGGIASSYKAALLLPVFFYSLQLGYHWGYGASLVNMVLLCSMLHRGGETRDYLELIAFSALFLLISLFAGKINYREKTRGWASALLSAIVLREQMTGLYNKRYYQKKMSRLLGRARPDAKIALILLEPYRFEQFKNNWGPGIANILIKRMAGMLRDVLDSNDIAAHLGEARFAVLAQERDLARIVNKGEKLRKKLNQNFEGGVEGEWSLPVAVGLSIYPDHATSAGGLLQKGEAALQRALWARGNRIQVYYSIYDRLSAQQNRQFMQALKRIMAPMPAWDRLVYGHSERVLIYAQLICRELGLAAKKAYAVEYAAFIHDMGKMELQKESTQQDSPWPANFKNIRQHPGRGAEMLRQQGGRMHLLIPAVLYHHEKYDGSGYPARLRGNAIPLAARIIAAADCFDCQTAEQPFGRGQSLQDGLDALLQDKGKDLDPLVAAAFVRGLERYEDIAHLLEWPKNLGRIVPCGYTPQYYARGGHYAEYYFGEVHFMVKAVYCMAASLANGEKCLYLVDNKKEKILLQQVNKLLTRNVDPPVRLKPGQLEKLVLPEHLLRSDLRSAKFEFEIKRLVKLWVDQAEYEQYSAIRLLIDHASLYLSGADLKRWEKLLTRCIDGQEVVVVCYYELEDVLTHMDMLNALHDSPLTLEINMLKENVNAR